MEVNAFVFLVKDLGLAFVVYLIFLAYLRIDIGVEGVEFLEGFRVFQVLYLSKLALFVTVALPEGRLRRIRYRLVRCRIALIDLIAVVSIAHTNRAFSRYTRHSSTGSTAFKRENVSKLPYKCLG